MGYTEVTLLVDGAVNAVEMYDDSAQEGMSNYLADIISRHKNDDAEVYIQYHGHDGGQPFEEEADETECVCSQYCDGDNNWYKPIWASELSVSHDGSH